METRRMRSGASILYTEDKVPVYNVMVQELPAKIKSGQIKRRFSRYGKIKDIHVRYGKTRKTPAQCVIKYWTKEGAAAALRKGKHELNKQRVTLMACPSWEQPFGHQENISTTNINNNNVGNLLALNDYCLEMIFQHLDLQYQIRLSLCHPRLLQVFAYMICPRLPRHIDLQDICLFSRWELRQYFHTFGTYMEKISVGKEFSSNNATNICSSMKECDLHIKYVHFILNKNWQYRNLFDVLNYDYITELELYYCGLSDVDLEYLRKLRNLETLGLAGNSYIQGTSLKHLRKLQRLSLYGCGRITNETLHECNRYLQLRYLDIRLVGTVTQITPYNYCETLETLKISRIGHPDGSFENILKLQNLKCLQVSNSYTRLAPQFWKSLAENRNDMLELKLTYMYSAQIAENLCRFRKLRTLWVCKNELGVTEDFLKLISNLTDLEEISLQGATHIRDNHLMPLLRNCTKLKRLNLRGCRYITNSLIFPLLNILQNRAEVTKKEKGASQTLVILAYGTGINFSILQHHVYKEGRHLLKLLFHNDDPLVGVTNEGSAFDIKDTATNCYNESYDDTDDDDDTDEDDDGYNDYYDDYDDYGDGYIDYAYYDDL